MRAEAAEPAIRGAFISPAKAWIVKTYGSDVFERGLAAIPEDQRTVFESELVSIAWYPLKHWTAILDGVRAEVRKRTGEDGPTFDRRNVHESISRAMQTIYRTAFAFLSPTTVVARVSPYFQRVYSHGEYDVVENEIGQCLLRFRNLPVEMLPELDRSFPLAAEWMLDIAGQKVTRQVFTPHVTGRVFSCDLASRYVPKRGASDAARRRKTSSVRRSPQVGPYEIVRYLGSGATSAVYEAVDPNGRHVALKLLHLPLEADRRHALRFLREARAAANVRHPHIVEILGSGEADGTAFLVMELLGGDTLASRLRERGKLSLKRALDLFLPLLSAVEALHAAGIVHRDIKPANILLAGGDRELAKLSDFGVSSLEGDSAVVTRSHDLLGTPAYMAPELVLYSARAASERSDQYSLGVTLYECVTGRRPFARESTYETMRSIVDGRVAPPSHVESSLPQDLDAALLRSMRADPEQRFASVGDFAAALREMGA